mmetsp:Transcript_95868/g.150833  ORF Transcript_95868/g.150833 Transcript_95868/m.150833 type:complete len:695 (+) Transcript_95868:47-2131(+)
MNSDEDVFLPGMDFSDEESEYGIDSSELEERQRRSFFDIATRMPQHNTSDRYLSLRKHSRKLFDVDVEFVAPSFTFDPTCDDPEWIGLCNEGRPVVLRGLPKEGKWKAWDMFHDVDSFIEQFGTVKMSVGTGIRAAARYARLSEPSKGLETSSKVFVDYATCVEVDWPLLAHEATVPETQICENAYPRFFEDLYELCPDVAPLDRGSQCVLGGELSGLSWQQNLKGTSLLHTVFLGRQRWALLPTQVAWHGQPAAWWMDERPKMEHRGLIEASLCRGDSIIIPPGWWYSSLNIPEDRVVVSFSNCGLFPATLGASLALLRVEAPRLAAKVVHSIRHLRPQLAIHLQDVDTDQAQPPQVVQGVCRGLDVADYHLDRLHFSQIDVSMFRRRHIPSTNPLIITGLSSWLTSKRSLGFGLEFLQEALDGSLEVPVKQQGASGTISEGTLLVSDFFKLLFDDELVYMADVSIANYFPWLFQDVMVPSYFLHDFNHRTRQRHFAANKTPSLFIGAKGTRSCLHIDQLCSNFWMFLSHGKKHWITFHPDDVEFLSPEYDETEQIHRFQDIDDLVKDSLCSDKLHCARRLDFVLEEGEVLFIPQGTPHQVHNLTETVAISSNFFDQSNVQCTLDKVAAKLEQLKGNQARYDNLETFHKALSEMDWPDLEEDLLFGSASTNKIAGLFPSHVALQHASPMNFRS